MILLLLSVRANQCISSWVWRKTLCSSEVQQLRRETVSNRHKHKTHTYTTHTLPRTVHSDRLGVTPRPSVLLLVTSLFLLLLHIKSFQVFTGLWCLPVICCVYVSADSYLSVHTHPSMEAHELLRIVGQKMDRAEDDTVLAVVSQTGGELTQTWQTHIPHSTHQ